MRIIYCALTMSICFYSCSNHNISETVPFQVLDKVENYHCWPYDVSVYMVDNINIDSVFYTYPKRVFFCEETKYQMASWSQYNVIDTTVWYGMNKTLEDCDDNQELYTHYINGDEIYYAGIYSQLWDRNSARRRQYECVLFLDVKGKKLHLFEDINN